MEKIEGFELSDVRTMNLTDRVPIVRQVLKDVATTLKHVNALSVRPFFVHGDLHDQNIMFKEREDGQLQFYIIDFGFGELKQHGGVIKPNQMFYQTRGTEDGFRNVGSVGNDLCTLCFSIAGLFLPYRDMRKTLPELWNSIYDILKQKQTKLKDTKIGKLIYQHFLNKNSAFYLGCNNNSTEWPLKDEELAHVKLAHVLSYEYGDADSDIAAIFEPTHFLDHYINASVDASSNGCIIS